MNLTEVVKRVSYGTNIRTVELQRIVAEIFKNVKYELVDGQDVEIRGFGVFKLIHVDERVVEDRDTGKPLTLPEHDAVRFYPAKGLNFITKDELDGKAY